MIARNPELIELSNDIETKTAAFLAAGGKIKTDLKSGLFTTGGFNNKKKKQPYCFSRQFKQISKQ